MLIWVIYYHHFVFTVWNHLAYWKQTLQESSLGGTLQKLEYWWWSRFNMAARVNNVFWLAKIFKIFSETTGQVWLCYCITVH